MTNAALAVIVVIVLGCFGIIALVWLLYKWRRIRQRSGRNKGERQSLGKLVVDRWLNESPPLSTASVPDKARSPLPSLKSLSSLSGPWKRSKSSSRAKSTLEDNALNAHTEDIEAALAVQMSLRRNSDGNIRSSLFYPTPPGATPIETPRSRSLASQGASSSPKILGSTRIPRRNPIPTVIVAPAKSGLGIAKAHMSPPVPQRKPVASDVQLSSPPKTIFSGRSEASGSEVGPKLIPLGANPPSPITWFRSSYTGRSQDFETNKPTPSPVEQPMIEPPLAMIVPNSTNLPPTHPKSTSRASEMTGESTYSFTQAAQETHSSSQLNRKIRTEKIMNAQDDKSRTASEHGLSSTSNLGHRSEKESSMTAMSRYHIPSALLSPPTTGMTIPPPLASPPPPAPGSPPPPLPQKSSERPGLSKERHSYVPGRSVESALLEHEFAAISSQEAPLTMAASHAEHEATKSTHTEGL